MWRTKFTCHSTTYSQKGAEEGRREGGERRGKDWNVVKKVLSGGVASNQYICKALAVVAKATGLRLRCPPARFCTHNGAMVAWNRVEHLREGTGILAPEVEVSYEPRAPLGMDITAKVRDAAIRPPPIRLPPIRIKLPA